MPWHGVAGSELCRLPAAHRRFRTATARGQRLPLSMLRSGHSFAAGTYTGVRYRWAVGNRSGSARSATFECVRIVLRLHVPGRKACDPFVLGHRYAGVPAVQPERPRQHRTQLFGGAGVWHEGASHLYERCLLVAAGRQPEIYNRACPSSRDRTPRARAGTSAGAPSALASQSRRGAVRGGLRDTIPSGTLERFDGNTTRREAR